MLGRILEEEEEWVEEEEGEEHCGFDLLVASVLSVLLSPLPGNTRTPRHDSKLSPGVTSSLYSSFLGVVAVPLNTHNLSPHVSPSQHIPLGSIS